MCNERANIMGSLMQDFKKQASFFLREKIKTARLAWTDATLAQILTEEVMNGDSMATNGYAMRLISQAAFEVDDYERIVQILHHRLCKFDKCNWRASYKALVVLEHLLTHGPQRIAEEFEEDEGTIRDMATIHFVDDKGFNWGLSAKHKSERIMKLLEDQTYLKEEREKARKLVTIGAKGFGSFSHKQDISDQVLRSKSLGFDDHRPPAVENNNFPGEDNQYTNLLVAGHSDFKGWPSRVHSSHEDHSFWDKENQMRVSLLSSG